jgi:DNA uptake protein ComE-like DNA-binding protein
MSRALLATVIALFVVTSGDVVFTQKAAGKPAAAAPAVVNLNTATATHIEYREKNGGFKKIEELMNVKGIGEKSFLKLKPLITVGDSKSATHQ